MEDILLAVLLILACHKLIVMITSGVGMLLVAWFLFSPIRKAISRHIACFLYKQNVYWILFSILPKGVVLLMKSGFDTCGIQLRTQRFLQ